MGMQRQTFKKGDRVRWKSGAHGNVTEKEGEIVCVFPAGWPPKKSYPRENFGMARDHESYVVYVYGRLYWPRVNHLQKVEA